MAAVVSKGETVGGLIYDPVGKDWRKGLKGTGAWAESASGKTRDLKVAAPAALSEMTGLSSWYLMPEPQRSRTVANLSKTAACFNYRCAPMNTDSSPTASCTSRCTTSSCPGTMRPAC